MSDLHFDVSTNKPTITYDINLLKTGKQEYSKTIDLDMAKGNQLVVPEEGKVLSKVVINKPETLISENVRENVNIGGIIGNLKPYVPIISSELNIEPSIESQVFTPSENEYYSKVNVNAVSSSIDSNIIPDNIRNGIKILGIEGTMLPQGEDMYQQLVGTVGKIPGLNNNSTITNYDFLNNLDTSEITDFGSVFYKDSKLSRIPNWNFSNGTNFYQMLYDCSIADNIVLNIPKAKNISSLFSSSGVLYEHLDRNISIINNTGTIGVIDNVFYNNINQTNFPLFDCTNVTTSSGAFYNCLAMEEIPNYTFTKLTKANQMFLACKKLKSVPNIFSNTITNASQMFQTCESLESCEIDLLSCTSNSQMFYNCYELTNLKLHNIKINTTIGTNTSYGTKITLDSLIFCIKELWSYKDTTTTRTLTMSTNSKDLITNTYVKLITPTQEQIEADPYIESKLPCQVCDSADEGAMTITAYANLKNWTIA